MMLDSDLKKIYDSRLMQTSEEIAVFESSLSRLVGSGSVSIISKLCLVFDDDTEQHGVMFSLVHGIEHLYENNVREGLRLIALVVPAAIDRSREWLEILHYRVLNHDSVRKEYGNVLSNLDDVSAKNTVIRLLEDIKKEDPEMFGGSVDDILNLI